VWDTYVPRILATDETGFGNIFSLAALAMVWKLLTEMVVVWLPPSRLGECPGNIDEYDSRQLF